MTRTVGARNVQFGERRNALIAKARERLSLQTGDSPSFRELALAAGVSVATLRHYFGSREALIKAVKPGTAHAMRWGVDACMAITALFMLMYGIQLCLATRHSTMAEFPAVSQGLVYLPIPIAGLLTLLFVFERVWVGDPPRTSYMYSDEAAELE